MRRHFGHVFMFAANDELVHTGLMHGDGRRRRLPPRRRHRGESWRPHQRAHQGAVKPTVRPVIPDRVLGPVSRRWDARRSRVERVVEARPFDPAVGAEILAGARENLRSTAGAKPTIDAGERWQFFLDRIRGDVEGFQTVREAIAYAQSAVDFDHRGTPPSSSPGPRTRRCCCAASIRSSSARSTRRRTRSGRGRLPNCGSAGSQSRTSPTSTCAMR